MGTKTKTKVARDQKKNQTIMIHITERFTGDKDALLAVQPMESPHWTWLKAKIQIKIEIIIRNRESPRPLYDKNYFNYYSYQLFLLYFLWENEMDGDGWNGKTGNNNVADQQNANIILWNDDGQYRNYNCKYRVINYSELCRLDSVSGRLSQQLSRLLSRQPRFEGGGE